MLDKGKHIACKNFYCSAKQVTFTTKRVLDNINKFGDVAPLQHAIENNLDVVDFWPYYLRISPALSCNYECKFCCIGMKDRTEVKKMPTLEELENIKPYYQNAFAFSMSGGDAFGMSDASLDRIFDPMKGKTRGWTSITTNGWGLTLDRYERYAVPNGPISRLYISLVTLNPETYKEIHNRPIERVLKNIDDICTKYPKHHIDGISAAVMSKTIHELPDIVRFCGKYGIKNVCFTTITVNRLNEKNCVGLSPWEDPVSYKATFESVDARTRAFADQLGVKLVSYEMFSNHIRNKICVESMTRPI